MDDPTWCTAKASIEGMRTTVTLTDDSLLLQYDGQPADLARAIELDRITGVLDQIGLITGYVTLTIEPDEKLVLARVSKSEAHRLVEALRARLPRHPVARPAAHEPDAGTGAPSTLEEIERLGRLREGGVLSEEEFQHAKETLLKRL